MARRVISILLLVGVLAAAGRAAVLAQDDPVAPSGDDGLRESLRAAFLADRRPARVAAAGGPLPCLNGQAGPYPCHNVDLLAQLSLSELGAGAGVLGTDIWGWTAGAGAEYALVGLTDGVAFVDVSTPTAPVYLGRLPSHNDVESAWRDVKVYGDHAYVVADGQPHGLQIFDLTALTAVSAPPVLFAPTAHYGEFGPAHNLAVNADTGFAYVVGSNLCNGGLLMLDLSNPVAPTQAGCFSEDGYTHDAHCVLYTGPDLAHRSAEICFNANEDTLTVADVTNKGAPVELSRTGYAGVGYTHQGWLTADQRYFLLGDELDELTFGHNSRTYIWDVADLDAPQLIGSYDGPTAATDHNLYVVGGQVFEANYRSGLRILDAAGVGGGTLTELAFFDTFPEADAAGFNGAWSSYPFFASGVLVLSDIEGGLFVLRQVTGPDFALQANPAVLNVCQVGAAATAVDVHARNGYSGDVALSLLNAPAGSVVAFDPNPVAAPDTSELTVDIVGAVPAGSYPLTVMGSDGTLTATVGVGLNVYEGAPGTAVLDAPADGATGVSRWPTFSWQTVAQAETYLLEVATDPGFTTIVYAATTTAITHALPERLPGQQIYYWRVTAMNVCGSAATSPTYDFTTEPTPPILLVDDDNNNPDHSTLYKFALNTLGLPFDVWETNNSDDEPDAAYLSEYQKVIWFSGAAIDTGFAGPGPGGEAALATFLEGGNCLMLGSVGYLADRGQTAFMSDYLGLAAGQSNVGSTEVAGAGPIFGALGPYGLIFGALNDSLTPDATAAVAFTANNPDYPDVGISKDNGVYRSLYVAFMVNNLTQASAATEIVSAFLGWCDTPRTPTSAGLRAFTGQARTPVTRGWLAPLGLIGAVLLAGLSAGRERAKRRRAAPGDRRR